MMHTLTSELYGAGSCSQGVSQRKEEDEPRLGRSSDVESNFKDLAACFCYSDGVSAYCWSKLRKFNCIIYGLASAAAAASVILVRLPNREKRNELY